MGTKIEWCDETINPIIGCTKVSEGCQNCYAERMANRLAKNPMLPDRYQNVIDRREWSGDLHFVPNELNKPGHWRKSKRIFVGSMGDIFHVDAQDEWISKIFDMAFDNPQHTFILLTKRPERMLEFVLENAYRRSFGWVDEERQIFTPDFCTHMDDMRMRNQCGWVGEGNWVCECPKNENMGQKDSCHEAECPIAYQANDRKTLEKIGVEDSYKFDSEGFALDCERMIFHSRPRSAMVGNIWFGVTVENQEQANKRIPILLQIPAKIRFVSVEPMLGPVDLAKWLPEPPQEVPSKLQTLNWVICGAETGPEARVMENNWAFDLQHQCLKSGIPFFFKKWNKGHIALPMQREFPNKR